MSSSSSCPSCFSALAGALFRQLQGRNEPPKKKKFGERDLNGKRKSLLIGINYIGQQGQLNGCINDVQTMRAFLEERGFTSDAQMVLTDDQSGPFAPTKENILNAFRWLVEGLKPGDNVFFHYSGHGGQQRDTSSDEKDQMDETLIPVDYQQCGMILDDTVYEMLVKPLPEGCRLTILLDCCHSGSGCDLPYEFKATAEACQDWWKHIPHMITSTKWDFKNFHSLLRQGGQVGFQIFQKYKAAREAERAENRLDGAVKDDDLDSEARFYREGSKNSLGEVVMISGCADHQTSADVGSVDGVFQLPPQCGPGGAGGACTNALIQSLHQKPEQKWIELLDNMRKLLQSKGFSQIPQLSSTVEIDLDRYFSLIE